MLSIDLSMSHLNTLVSFQRSSRLSVLVDKMTGWLCGTGNGVLNGA